MNKKIEYVLYWVLSFTWALPTTVLGAIAAMVLILFGNKPKKFGPALDFEIGNGFGVSMGLFFVSGKSGSNLNKCHELGHHLQSCFLFGPFSIFCVYIPSVIRFWMREMKTYKKKMGFLIFVHVFAIILFSVFLFVSMLANIVWIEIISGVMIAYFTGLFSWFMISELPKYKKLPYPLYNSIYIEKNATARGVSFMNRHYGKVK